MGDMTFKKRKATSAKKSKVASNLEKTLTQYLHGRRYTPSTLPELIRQLDIAEIHHPLLKQILDDLVQKGEIALIHQKYSLPSSAKLVTGTISVHQKGFGFVRCEEDPMSSSQNTPYKMLSMATPLKWK